MRYLMLAASLLLPTTAWAQTAPAQKPDVVVMPRQIVEGLLAWLERPNADNAVGLHAIGMACLNDNPRDGAITRMGPDQCEIVTVALAQADAKIADLQKQLDAAKKAATPDEAPKP